jgi:hypothetical protein
MAGVVYRRFDGKRCSREWHIILTAARADGVDFRLNSGKRTMAEQQWLYDHQPPLAAYPSPTAPHIRVGRFDHAADFWRAFAIMAWMRRNGMPSARLTVPGESWHVEVRADELRRAAKRLAVKPDPLAHLTRSERRWVREYDRLRRVNRDLARRRVLRRHMTRARKRVWREAQKSGWDKRNRAKRYRSLLARTR